MLSFFWVEILKIAAPFLGADQVLKVQTIVATPSLWQFAAVVAGVVAFGSALVKFITYIAIHLGWKDANKKQLNELSDSLDSISDQLRELDVKIEDIEEVLKPFPIVVKESHALKILNETPVGCKPKSWCIAKDFDLKEEVEEILKDLDAIKGELLHISRNQKRIVRVVQATMESQSKDLDEFDDF